MYKVCDNTGAEQVGKGRNKRLQFALVHTIVILVPKRVWTDSQNIDFCIDFGALTAVRRFEEMTSTLVGSKYLSVLDCK
jgi:hypothetical protein